MLGVAWVASVLAHEIGHLVGARVGGLEPFTVWVGGGPSVFRCDVLGVGLDVGVLPGGGLCCFASRDERRLKWRLLLAYAGGPLVSMAVLATGGWLLENDLRGFAAKALWLTPSGALILVNAILVISSFLPFPQSRDGAGLRSDLMQILSLPWLTVERARALIRARTGAGFARLMTLGRYEEALDEARKRLHADPSDWALRLTFADTLVFVRRHDEAAIVYERLLDEPALAASWVPPLVRAYVANNYAFSRLMLGDPGSLEAALRTSEEALRLAPSHPSILGTRGTVLVIAGEVQEGTRLLQRAQRLHRKREDKAYAIAALAIAAAREMRRDEATRLLKRARNLDPECEFLERAEYEVSAQEARAPRNQP